MGGGGSGGGEGGSNTLTTTSTCTQCCSDLDTVIHQCTEHESSTSLLSSLQLQDDHHHHRHQHDSDHDPHLMISTTSPTTASTSASTSISVLALASSSDREQTATTLSPPPCRPQTINVEKQNQETKQPHDHEHEDEEAEKEDQTLLPDHPKFGRTGSSEVIERDGFHSQVKIMQPHKYLQFEAWNFLKARFKVCWTKCRLSRRGRLPKDKFEKSQISLLQVTQINCFKQLCLDLFRYHYSFSSLYKNSSKLRDYILQWDQLISLDASYSLASHTLTSDVDTFISQASQLISRPSISLTDRWKLRRKAKALTKRSETFQKSWHDHGVKKEIAKCMGNRCLGDMIRAGKIMHEANREIMRGVLDMVILWGVGQSIEAAGK